MAINPQNVERLIKALDGLVGLREQKMMGGLCVMLNGNMLCGTNDDRFMFRVGKEQQAEALTRPNASDVAFNGRKMGGLIWVDADEASADDLKDWLSMALTFVGPMPAK